MQYIFLSILSIPFLYINYKIIISDIKEKKIPNKFLLYLLLLIPFYYLYLISFNANFEIIGFIIQIIITLIISFILYSIGIWSAGDAKYLLVLGLFIPNIGIMSFIGNIALLTLLYLLLYFIWFYSIKCIFYKGYAKSLIEQIKKDLIEKWDIYKKNKGGNTIFIILKYIVWFLTIFVAIRISRIYILKYIFNGENQNSYILNFINNYNIYIFGGFLILFIGVVYLIRYFIFKINNYINKKLDIKINNDTISKILLFILFISLNTFIIYEYINNKEEIINSLYKLLTISLLIYIIFKILKYGYNITFNISEMSFININGLKKSFIVDKNYLIKMFGEQEALGFCKPNEKPDFQESMSELLLYPNPKEYFTKIENPINEDDSNKIKEIYKIVNNFHKENNPQYEENNNIKILNTFSFAHYIFIGFLITFIFENKIILFLTSVIIEKIKSQF